VRQVLCIARNLRLGVPPRHLLSVSGTTDL